MFRRDALPLTRLRVYVLVYFMAFNLAVPGAEGQDDGMGEDDVGEFIKAKKKECTLMYENVSLPGVSKDFHCPARFDGFLCWPPTAPGDTAEMLCPVVFDQYQTVSVHSTCFVNATWKEENIYDVYGPDGMCQCFHCKITGELLVAEYALSFAACAVAFVIFMSSRTLRCTRNLIHLHLITSFMLKYIVYFIQPPIWKSELLHLRRIVLFLLFYFEQTNYFWMFVEGLYLHTLVVFALRIDADRINFLVYCVIGWAIPMVLIGVWAIISAVLDPDVYLIFNSGDNDFFTNSVHTTAVHEYVCLIGPILLVLVINCFFLLNIVRLLMSKLRVQGNRTSDIKQYRRAARATFVLVILLGVGYVLILVLPLFPGNLPTAVNLIFVYVSTVLAGTQGLSVSVIYVFLNTEVRSVLRRKWRRRLAHIALPPFLSRKRTKPRTSSYSKYDDRTCVSTMRSMANNDTVMDSCHEDYVGHQGHHQGNTTWRRGNTQERHTGGVANGDTSAKESNNEEKIEMQVVKSNGTVGKWDQIEREKEADEVEPLLEEGGKVPKPPASIVISEASPVHTSAEEPVAEYVEHQE
ncbi:corticotropin-releasing factor receptor 1-like isoform X2 [Acanthaster planci]|uniref:Corticotropin-releasing factor receptor 1-like isoform X2 n=1 Tax=Acanthaster planci TaxID=133434 RepID=A0A8B7Y1Q3_ACAPL|nr:corticotropin-releasing factor receptor 1-like isoform X2 [Acanthaster planci]